MNPEIKAAWIQWLHDNADNQGTGYLNIGGKFCCLGGLCELAVQAGVARAKIWGAEIVSYGALPDHADFVDDVLPSAVANWAGLRGEGNPRVRATRPLTEEQVEAGEEPFEEESVALTEINDGWHLDFHQIAELIDRNL